MARHQPKDIERLLEQGRWVRRLAARLVDEGAAEDVVQDTWVAALQGAPPGLSEGTGPGRLRAWLAGAASNLARKRHRDDGARTRREEVRAQDPNEGGGDPSDELARLELQRKVVELVLGLEEPYRSTVVARYLDQREVREIATDKGLSAAAVRQRLSRGLAQLRARLDDEHGGDRGAWSHALGPLIALPTPAALPLASAPSAAPPTPGGGGALWTSSLPLTGGLFLATKSSLGALAAAAALALVSLGAYLATRPTEHSDATGAPSVATPASGVSVAPNASLASTAQPLEATTPSLRTRGGAAARAGGEGRGAWIEGHVMDRSGTPVEGALVHYVDQDGSTLSGSDGRFRLSLPELAEGPLLVRARFSNLMPAERVIHEPERGVADFVLLEKPRITGRVLDPDGAPARGPGQFWIEWRISRDTTGSLECALDDEGRFELDVPNACIWTGYYAMVKGFPRSDHEVEIELVGGDVHELEIRLVHGARVTGRVLDALTQQPVPGAKVWTDDMNWSGESLGPTAIADAQGFFELTGVGPRRHVLDDGTVLALIRILAAAEGYASSPLRAYADAWSERGPFHFEVSISPSGCNLIGIVLEADGETPATGSHVHGIDAEGNYRIEVADQGGGFRFEDCPTGGFSVLVRRGEYQDPGGGFSRSARFELLPGDSPVERIVLGGDFTGRIEGVLRASDGSPVEGASVEAAHFFGGDGVRISLDSARTVTDASGRYRFERLPPGGYTIAPKVAGCVSPTGAEAMLEEEETRRHVDFVVSPCLRIAGRALVEQDPARGLRVALFESGGERVTSHADLGDDGSFALEPIARGVYELRLLSGKAVLERREVGPQDIPDMLLDVRE